jgi:hypothetical protein
MEVIGALFLTAVAFGIALARGGSLQEPKDSAWRRGSQCPRPLTRRLA